MNLIININLQDEKYSTNNTMKCLCDNIVCIPSLKLSLAQLTNLSTYLDFVDKYPNTINVINKIDNIIQALNYDSDEFNNFWIILTNNYMLIDISIPLYADFNNDKIFDNLSLEEIKIVKLLKFKNNI